MKKAIAILFSIILVFTLIGCGDKTPTTANKNKDSKKYIPEHSLPKDLPIYPGAVLNRGYEVNVTDIDEETEEEIEVIHWAWTFSTTGSAREIIDFYKNELTELGYELKSETLHGNYFGLSTVDSDIHISYAIIGKSNSDSLPDLVMPDTPGRDYSIQIHPDKWKNR